VKFLIFLFQKFSLLNHFFKKRILLPYYILRSSLFTLILILIFIYSILNISSCAGPSAVTEKESIYPSDYPLTEDLAYSLSSDLTVRIPQGWTAAEDNDCKCIDLWLIRNDFSATLNLVTYEVDDEIRKAAINGKLDTLVYFSKKLKRIKLKNGFKQETEDEFFKLNDKDFAAYEYIGDEDLPIRIVVFQFQGRIFELSAMPAQKVGKGIIDTEELFTIQQAVLASIK
jgi:hypothetical protein